MNPNEINGGPQANMPAQPNTPPQQPQDPQPLQIQPQQPQVWSQQPQAWPQQPQVETQQYAGFAPQQATTPEPPFFNQEPTPAGTPNQQGMQDPGMQPAQEPQAGPPRNSIKKFLTKKNLIIAGAAIVAVAVIITGALVIPGLLPGGKSSEGGAHTLLETDSFFAPDERGEKFALFNGKTEKRLTDYQFIWGSVFVNNTAIVLNEAREHGIIKDDGTMVIDFGKYKDIERVGTLYELGRSTDEDHTLVNSSGKTVKIPGGGKEWSSAMSAEAGLGEVDTYHQFSENLYPIIEVKGETEDEPSTYYALNYDGKVLLEDKESSFFERRTTTGRYSVIGNKTTHYILDNVTQKVIGKYADIGVSQSLGDISIFPLEPEGYDKKAIKTIVAKDGKITGEFVANNCQYVRVEKMPSDDSLVVRCKSNEAGYNSQLIDTSGKVLAEGSVFYTKDTYLSYDKAAETVKFHKGGSVVKTVKNCRGYVALMGEPYTATEAYVVEDTCADTKGVDYLVYSTDGTLIKNGGAEWDLGSTRFGKNGLGIAEKKVKSGTTNERYLINTSLEVQKGPFGKGDFYLAQGQLVYVSFTTRQGLNDSAAHSGAVYSADFSKKIAEAKGNLFPVRGAQHVAEINNYTTLYHPMEVAIFKNSDSGDTHSFIDVTTGNVVDSGVPGDVTVAGMERFIRYYRFEDSDDNFHYYFLSGNSVPKK